MPFAHVPGETPLDDRSGLRDKTIKTRQQLNRAEAENIRIAVFRYFASPLTRRKAPFTYSWALKLHQEMFGDVWTWAGTLRTHDLNIGKPHDQIEQLLFDLFQRMPHWVRQPFLVQAAILHYEAVAIHPFVNGNGRWSRMLANLWLHVNRQPLTRWPEDVAVHSNT
ncbi:MAG: Fic family protein, partial [Candidatus Acidiferrum sp.]